MAIYLVTGAAGFIGARVVEFLLADGHEVIGWDNLNDAYDVRMKEYRLGQLKKYPNFTFQRLDIADRAVLEMRFTGHKPEAVINLAARAGVRTSVENPWVYLDTNMTGTLNLLELCRLLEIPKFILASTSSVYGMNVPLPTPEDVDTNHPLQPYAASKKGAEVLCHAYTHLHNIDVTVFRYFTVYGPAGRPDMILFRLVQWISEGRPVEVTGDGQQSRGFTYVDDIARGTILGLKLMGDGRKAGYEIMNLGGHEVVAINELVRMVEERTGRRADVTYIPRHPADMLTNWADIEKARRLLGWEPQVSLSEGINRLVEWYQAERSWARLIVTTAASGA
jgi:UDP-glucuronate 4-epimerase